MQRKTQIITDSRYKSDLVALKNFTHLNEQKKGVAKVLVYKSDKPIKKDAQKRKITNFPQKMILNIHNLTTCGQN